MPGSLWKMGFLAVAVWASLLTTVTVSGRLAVMSVDLGSEFMKIAIVKPGVPMEIVINKESNRKTATLVAFRDGERHFGNQAESTAMKFPPKGFRYLSMVLGRRFDDPQVKAFKERFPYYNLLKDEDRGTVLFKVDDETTYSPEELLAMILEKAREYAQEFAEQDIKDVVITVPAFYNQAERRAVTAAANMVGLNVLQLMSDNAAVALNYGVFRRKNFNSTTQYYMFYDMGSTSTTATVVGYNVVKTKEGTRMESNPQLTIKGVGFDRSLGGLEFSLRLRAHLARMFNGQKKTQTQVETNNRAMAKLFKESERVKKVLSTNQDHYAQVEGLLEEKDFRGHVSRAELEEMCKDLLARVTKPIEDALKFSEITLPEINEVILMGGGTRMPKVQELLVNYLGGSTLGKGINTDEAAALGAVYQAAYLGKGFKVKKFGVREANIYPINVEFEKQKSEDEASSEEKARMIKRTLFGRMNPYPQKKVMTFNKHTKDFSFNVIYSGLDFLNEEEKLSFGPGLISKYRLEGVEQVLSKNKEQAEAKGIKAHFRMDESGILTLDKVESVFEKNSSTDDTAEKSTWSKLGSAIGGLFGGSKQEEDNKVEDSNETDEKDTSGKAEGENSSSSSPTKEEPDKGEKKGEEKEAPSKEEKKEEREEEEKKKRTPSEEEEAKKESKKEEQTEKSTNEGETDEQKEKEEEATKDGEKETGKDGEKEPEGEKTEQKEEEKPKDNTDKEEDKKDKKEGDAPTKDGEKKEEKKEEEKKDTAPKTVTIKEDISTKSEVLDLTDISPERLKESKKRLSALSAADKEKVELEKAKNELEAFIFDMQDKLSQEGPHQDCTTEEERDKLNSELSQASDWLYEQPDDAKKTVFTDKVKSLRALTKDLERRVYELGERPKALEALRGALNQSSVFLETVKNISDAEDPVFTAVELNTMEKLINETLAWREEALKQQDQLALHQMPSLLVEDVGAKIAALDREMRYLINKAKNFKPKPKPKPEANKTETDTNTTKTEDFAEGTQDSEPTPTEEGDQTADQTSDQTSDQRQEPVEPQEPEVAQPDADTGAEEERTSSDAAPDSPKEEEPHTEL